MVCCSAAQDVSCVEYCFVTLARRSEMDGICLRTAFPSVACARIVSLALSKMILENPGGMLTTMFKNYTIYGALLSSYIL